MFDEPPGSVDFVIALCVTFGGLVLVAVLIGGISELIAEKHRQLKRGKNPIVESGHFLVCGWNDKAGAILQQLAEAQCSPNEFTVVFLSDRDKEEMDEALDSVDTAQPIRWLCRMGDAWNADSLRGVAVQTARAIILLSTIGDNVSDAPSVKSLLAILALTQQPEEQRHAPDESRPPAIGPQSIVVECVEPENVSLLESLDPRITAVSPRQWIGRLLVQTSRQFGLSTVYSALLGFSGSEFYLFPCPSALVGRTFRNLLSAFDDGAVVVGVLKESERDSRFPSMLNPLSDDIVIEEGDSIVLLAENANSFALDAHSNDTSHGVLQSISSDAMMISDEDRQPLLPPSGVSAGGSSSSSVSRVVPASSYGSSSSSSGVLSPSASLSAGAYSLPTWRELAPCSRHILMVEWRSDIDSMLEQLNEYVHPGSTVTIYFHKPIAERNSVFAPVGPRLLRNLRILHVQGSTLNHSEFERFFLSHKQTYDSVLVLSDVPAVLSLQQAKEADARALMSTILIDAVIRAEARKADTRTKQHADTKQEPQHDRTTQDHDSPSDVAAASAVSPPSPVSSSVRVAPRRPAIVSEISDVHTKHLVQSYDRSVGEWIVSHELIACALVQMAYQPACKSIWSELFLPYGNEIYLRDVRYYVSLGVAVSFVDVYRVGRLRSEIVLGYVMRADGDGTSVHSLCSPVLNPSNKQQRCLTFHEGDQIIVIAQDFKGR